MTKEDREEVARIFRVELQAALRSFATSPTEIVLPPAITNRKAAELAALMSRDKFRQKQALKGVFYD